MPPTRSRLTVTCAPLTEAASVEQELRARVSTLVQSIAAGHVIHKILAKAQEFRDVFGDEGKARVLEWAADQVEQALRDESNCLLTIEEAAHASGYSEQHLARLVRQGRVPDLRPRGSKGRILIRASDLPTKPAGRHTPVADGHGLASRLYGGKGA